VIDKSNTREFKDYAGIKYCTKREKEFYEERTDKSAIVFSIVLNTVYEIGKRTEHNVLINDRNITKIDGHYYFLRIECGNYIMHNTRKSILRIDNLEDYIVYAKNQAINMSFADIEISDTKTNTYSKFLMRSDYENYIMMLEIIYDSNEIKVPDIMNINPGDVIYADRPMRVTTTRSFW